MPASWKPEPPATGSRHLARLVEKFNRPDKVFLVPPSRRAPGIIGVMPRRYSSALLLCALTLLAPMSTWAQPIPPATEARISAVETAVKSAQSAGDNAWMLVSAALVLMMTGPGLALFYGGLVRPKNVLSTMMHSFILMAVVTVIWAVVGYSLAFGEGSWFLGDLRYAFLNGVGAAPNADYAPTIPQQTFMIYQLMFAIITPALISGAYAERMKFSAMLLFTVLWMLLVYFPLAHMVWGKGGLLNAFLGGRIPCSRFRGRNGGAHQLRRIGAGLRRCIWASASAIPTNR